MIGGRLDPSPRITRQFVTVLARCSSIAAELGGSMQACCGGSAQLSSGIIRMTMHPNGNSAPQAVAAGSGRAASLKAIEPHRWQKGTSGNPSGSSAAVEQARARIKALAAEKSEYAL